MSQPVISVILPVYNVEPYLRESLDSDLAQTFSDWEVICIDDGSTDGCGVILEEYARRDGRIRVLRQPNAGQSSARNAGLNAAVGDYVAFLDADDRFAPDFCESLLNEARDTDADMTTCFFRLFGDASVWRVPRPLDEARVLERDADQIGLYARLGTYVWTTLWRRDFLENNRLRFLADAIPYEDTPFTFLGAARAKRICVVGRALYDYRIRTDSSSGAIRPEKALNLMKAYGAAAADLYRVGVSPQAADLLLTKKVNDLFAQYRTDVRKASKSFRKIYFEKLAESFSDEEIDRLTDRRLKFLHIARLFFLGRLGRRRRGFYRCLFALSMTRKDLSACLKKLFRR